MVQTLIGRRLITAPANTLRTRTFRSSSALEALSKASKNRTPNVALYNYPSFSGAYSALLSLLFHSHLNLPCLTLPFSSVEPLRYRPIGAVIYMQINNLKMSLRTMDAATDTSKVAKAYDGGGSPSSSSFIIKMDEYNQWLPINQPQRQ